MDVGNLISGSSVFSKSNLNIRKFMVHVLLKLRLENFEHYFASVWGECICAVVWTFLWHSLSLELEWKLTFSSPVATTEFSKFAGHLWVAQSQTWLKWLSSSSSSWHIEYSTLTASSFRLWNWVFSLGKLLATSESNFTIVINKKDALYAICQIKIVFLCVYAYILYMYALCTHNICILMYILWICK